MCVPYLNSWKGRYEIPHPTEMYVYGIPYLLMNECMYLFIYLVNSEDGGIDKNIKEVD